VRPPNTKNLRCTLEVRLIPGGEVMAVRVIRSSGNAAFDRSVENAVYRAAPLAVPSGSLFESFRTLTFVFDPSKN
jgi:colicin import membrane protein